MKASMCTTLMFILIGMSLLSFANKDTTYANKITVTGYPVYLNERNGIYEVPNTFVTGVYANYVTLDGVRHVCYLSPVPKLNVLNKKTVIVVIKGALIRWTCYQFDDNYFIYSP